MGTDTQLANACKDAIATGRKMAKGQVNTGLYDDFVRHIRTLDSKVQ